MSIFIIAAFDENMVMGNNQQLPWHLPEDLAWFKRLTINRVVCMGRKTWESIPPRFRPLPRRRNIILSTTMKSAAGANVVRDHNEILNMKKNVFIIGGSEIYQLFLPHADKLYISHVVGTHEGDTYFPTIDYESWDHEISETYDSHQSIIYTRK